MKVTTQKSPCDSLKVLHIHQRNHYRKPSTYSKTSEVSLVENLSLGKFLLSFLANSSFIKENQVLNLDSEVYSKPIQTSKMRLLTKVINDFQLFSSINPSRIPFPVLLRVKVLQ